MNLLSAISAGLVLSGFITVAGEISEKQVLALADRYCLDCHDADSAKGNLNLESALRDPIQAHSDTWEKVVRRLMTRQMPPVGKKSRPTEAEFTLLTRDLSSVLDNDARTKPNPGRTETIRRLNRAEYQNAIRDLLTLEVDAGSLLPPDEASHGFDNMSVGTLPPTLLDRYITAAQRISRLAIGSGQTAMGGETIRVKPDITQNQRVDGLPLGTRGGTWIPYTFPLDGEYELQFRLTRDRNDEVEGLSESHELLALLDRAEMGTFTVQPAKNGQHDAVDSHLKLRSQVKAGPHQIGVTFLKNPDSLLEYKRQPYAAQFNFHRHPRTAPAIYQVSITGPFHATGPGETPSRKRLFLSYPKTPDEEESCAKSILTSLLHRAWRRPVTEADVSRVLPFFREGQKESGFEGGIESALSAVLVSREFLFRVEQPPAGIAPDTAYSVSDLDLASRLSFFLWSSIPDDQLLTLAAAGQLHEPSMLETQARRLLADPRSDSLVSNFAGQWLHLRNLDSTTPDGRLFPDFDDNLRQAMREETSRLFAEMAQENRSVLDLLRTDHTFINERLARHYGIPHVYGPRFRRISLNPEDHRGGILRHASILMVTSYATRTAPTIRGKWILENLVGTPPPPPAPDVPALDESVVSEKLPVRVRLAAHREKTACASCHDFIDPPGFALENYDAVGRWRTLESGHAVDASGGLPDGSRFNGIDGLEQAMLAHPEIFVTTFTEKLLAFALGRKTEPGDGPAIREIVRRAQAQEYRFSEIVTGIVSSVPFTMRKSL